MDHNAASESQVNPRASEAETRLSTLSSLLSTIDESSHVNTLAPSKAAHRHELRLVQARLGIASSLFLGLRAKHAPTASHCLRVALGVSSWGMTAELSGEEQDAIEVGALLHDIGKIGVPDHVLMKPGKLSGEELLLMERHHQLGQEILGSCCASRDVLEIVRYSSAWYDGSRRGLDRSRNEIPLGARMIAIVDAFDSMTTDHVYRRAMPRELALAELFQHAGTQFDPELVPSFSSLLSQDKVQFNANVSRRWLQQLEREPCHRFWSCEDVAVQPSPIPSTLPFQERLLDSMHDGVVFVDHSLQVTMWNRAASRLTGIAEESVVGHLWSPNLVRMQDDQGRNIPDEECPIARAVHGSAQTMRRVSVAGRRNGRVSVDLHVAPVSGPDGVAQGGILILHDASSQVTLEERVQTLHEKATRDPLTKAANRAEFDRVLPEFVRTHLERDLPCAMIICDIDHFKQVNDTYGHPAGDDALVQFAALLQQHARSGDLVARYGGEEFVILCADCDNATATRRAEDLRRHVAEQQLPSLSNKSVTASFGVTEVQGGDTAESFLRRADRALLQAKDNGRNLVVQLGTGISSEERFPRSATWFRWLSAAPTEELLSRRLFTIVPLNVTAEKLRGFVADHHAEIVEIEDNRATLKIEGQDTLLMRRRNDRPVPFMIELTFDERPGVGGAQMRTLIHVVIRPKRQRDRRRTDAVERARQLLSSLKSYLMAHDYSETDGPTQECENRESFLRKSKRILTYWLSQ